MPLSHVIPYSSIIYSDTCGAAMDCALGVCTWMPLSSRGWFSVTSRHFYFHGVLYSDVGPDPPYIRVGSLCLSTCLVDYTCAEQTMVGVSVGMRPP